MSPIYQNKGLGKQVLIHIEKQVQGLGYQSIRLDVYTKNPYAKSYMKIMDIRSVDLLIGEKDVLF